MTDPHTYFGGINDVRNLIYQQLDPKTVTFIGQLVKDDLGSKTDAIWINHMRREYPDYMKYKPSTISYYQQYQDIKNYVRRPVHNYALKMIQEDRIDILSAWYYDDARCASFILEETIKADKIEMVKIMLTDWSIRFTTTNSDAIIKTVIAHKRYDYIDIIINSNGVLDTKEWILQECKKFDRWLFKFYRLAYQMGDLVVLDIIGDYIIDENLNEGSLFELCIIRYVSDDIIRDIRDHKYDLVRRLLNILPDGYSALVGMQDLRNIQLDDASFMFLIKEVLILPGHKRNLFENERYITLLLKANRVPIHPEDLACLVSKGNTEILDLVYKTRGVLPSAFSFSSRTNNGSVMIWGINHGLKPYFIALPASECYAGIYDALARNHIVYTYDEYLEAREVNEHADDIAHILIGYDLLTIPDNTM